MNIFETEDKFKKWIENNGIKWGFILFGIGIILGILSSILLGAETQQATTTGFGYGLLLVIIEISAGGSGN